MKNRDIETLSAYLDGQLSEAESKRLKERLESDVELASVLSDIRSARNILNKLPQRKAPKNFTLTRKMVGLKPPLPRTYPLFRLATVFATVLFVFSFSVNAFSPLVNVNAPAFGYGGGGGGPAFLQPAAATEEAMMMESATEAATEAVENANIETTPTAKEVTAEDSSAQDSAPALPTQPQITEEANKIPSAWVSTFLIIGVVGAFIMFVINQNAKRKWQ